jgi:hypothetical protein
MMRARPIASRRRRSARRPCAGCVTCWTLRAACSSSSTMDTEITRVYIASAVLDAP